VRELFVLQKAVARYIANIKAMAAIREKEQDRLYERYVLAPPPCILGPIDLFSLII
jgi:hypothetical protein